MRYINIILISLIGISAVAQHYSEIAPVVTINPDATNYRDTFNLAFSFPCTAFMGEYGVAVDNNDEVYVSQWSGELFAKYDQAGNVLDTFSITGVSEVRDMTYDGEFLFGSPSDNYFYVIDMEIDTLVATVQIPYRIRGIAHDYDDFTFWISEHWSSNFYEVDAAGNVLDSVIPTGVTLNAISGLAYDKDWWYGGEFLWGFSQDSTGAIIVKYDIASQTQLGSMIDVSGLADGIAGGLSMYSPDAMEEPILVGIIQNELVFALERDYANQLVGQEVNDFIKTLEIFPNPVKNVLNIAIELEGNTDLKFSIVNQLGQTIHSQVVNVISSKTLVFNTSLLESGIYFVKINNESGYSITKKFVVAK